MDKAGKYWDDVNPDILSPDAVVQAMREDMSLFKNHDVYHIFPFTGQRLIETRWVDTENDGVRSRLVAGEFRQHRGWDRDLAEGAPTPP